MANPRKVVVAGYGAWAMTATNPAAETLKLLRAQTWPDCDLVALEVPVRTDGLMDFVEEALITHKPEIWLGLGVAPEAMTIRMEAIGVNCRDFIVPDNEGVQHKGEAILEEGPAAFFSTLPSREIVEAMLKAGIPAELSYSAGTHLCNQMLYSSLHLIETHRLQTLSGFLHVPYTPEFVAEHLASEGIKPSLPLSVMAKAATVAVTHTLAQTARGTAREPALA